MCSEGVQGEDVSVSRRSDGRWIVKYRDGGAWKQKSFRDEATAMAFDAEMREPEEADGRLSMGELALSYLRSRPDLHRSTRSSILWLLADGGPAAFLRDKYADALNRQDLERMREALRARQTSNNTINHYQSYLCSILAWGVEQDFLPRHPWPYRKLKTARPVVRAQLRDLLRIFPELPGWLQWAVKTAFFLALRPGHVELFGLRWSAFDFRRRQVVIVQGKSGKPKTVIIRNDAYLREAALRCAHDQRHGIGLVCHRGDGQPVRCYRRAWETACRRAGVSMRLYDVRHIAATVMLGEGADLAAVAAQLGHQSVATTGAIYAHVTPTGQARAAELMPSLDHVIDVQAIGK